MAALFWKEFRETVRWFPCCLFLVVFLLWRWVPGVDDVLMAENLSSNLESVGMAASIIATALAGAQFAFDQKTSARAFLLHRKQTARQIFHAKVAVGALFYALAVFVPLTYTAFYLEWMGPERLPTTWYQAVPAIARSFYCFSLYFGVIWVICRPARWLGTRLLPLFGSGLINQTHGALTTPFPMDVLVMVFGLATFVLLVFASRSAFENGEKSIATQAKTPISFATKSMLWLSSLAVVSWAFSLPYSIVGSSDQSYQVVKIDSKGDPWLVNQYRASGINADQDVTRLPIVEDASNIAVQEVPEDWNESSFFFVPVSKEAEVGWDFKKLNHTVNGTWFLDDKGRILAYEFNGNQKGVIGFRVIERKAIDGISLQSSKTFNTLIDNQFFSTRIKPNVVDLFADAHGFYVVGPKDRQCYTLLDKSIDGFSEDYRGGDKNDHALIVIASEKAVTIYRLEKSDSTPSGFVLVQGQTLDTEIELGKYGNTFAFIGDVHWPAPTEWTWVSQLSGKEYRVHRKRSTDDKPETYAFQLPNEWAPEDRNHKLMFGPETTVVVCAQSVIATGIVNLMDTPNVGRVESVIEDIWTASPLIAVMAFLATIVTYAMARVRGLSTRQQITWSLIGFVSGLGAALAVVAIYPQVHLVQCAGCNRKRRIERDRCEHCGAEWEQPATEGIEIVETFEDKRESIELLTH